MLNRNGHDYWDLASAASKLTGHACSISARHLAHGIPCMQFNREVADYARRIIRDVSSGGMSLEDGLNALVQEARHLSSQARHLQYGHGEIISQAIKRIPVYALTHAVLKPDPTRLLRFVHAQSLRLNTEPVRGMAPALMAAPVSPPVIKYPFHPEKPWSPPLQLNEPGFYIVPKSTTGSSLEALLFTTLKRDVLLKFRALNPNLDEVKAGQMIVLVDPENMRCTREEAQLMDAAATVNAALKDLSPSEADFMMRHREEIESFLTQGSTSIGVGAAIFGSHLERVKTLLSDIEALHQRAFLRDGHLRSPEFFAERKRLFAQLDTHLNGLARKGTGFPDHPHLKSALGISSRSLVHRWTKAGAPGQIPGYATHMTGVAKAAKYIKYGGWFGTAVGGGASYMKVQDVCAAGDAEACERVKFAESGNFGGVVGGGAVAGLLLSGSTAAAICVGLSVPTAGAAAVVCGLVVVGVGAYAGGAIGGPIGERAGEAIYEVAR